MSNVQDNIERLLLLDYLSSQVSKIIINPTQLQCPQTTVITIKHDSPKATNSGHFLTATDNCVVGLKATQQERNPCD